MAKIITKNEDGEEVVVKKVVEEVEVVRKAGDPIPNDELAPGTTGPFGKSTK